MREPLSAFAAEILMLSSFFDGSEAPARRKLVRTAEDVNEDDLATEDVLRIHRLPSRLLSPYRRLVQHVCTVFRRAHSKAYQVLFLSPWK